ncbi:MAG TPA: endonuclease domain-containing protein [Burkholderiales bacterium]
METKHCRVCDTTKPIEEFQAFTVKAKRGKPYHGHNPQCIPCRNRLRREDMEAKERANVKRRALYAAGGEHRAKLLEAQFRSRHGIGYQERDAILAEQGNSCAICMTTEPGGKGWIVDHDHSCCPDGKSCPGCRRGILCGNCNLALGHVKDDEGIALDLCSYILHYKYERTPMPKPKVPGPGTRNTRATAAKKPFSEAPKKTYRAATPTGAGNRSAVAKAPANNLNAFGVKDSGQSVGGARPPGGFKLAVPRPRAGGIRGGQTDTSIPQVRYGGWYNPDPSPAPLRTSGKRKKA